MVPAFGDAFGLVGCGVEWFGFGPCGEGTTLVVEGGDAEGVGEIEWFGFSFRRTIEADGLFDLGAGDAILLHLRPRFRGMAQRVGELGGGIGGTEEGDGFGVVDGRAEAIALVAPGLGNTRQGLRALDRLRGLGLRGGLLEEALGLGGLAAAAGAGGLLEQGFELV